MKKKIIPITLIAIAAIVVLGATGLLIRQVFFANQGDDPRFNEADEFIIETADQLYELVKLSKTEDLSGKTFKLGADIVVNEGNASEWAEKAPKRKWYPIVNFAGTFDGQGHTISGLYGRAYDDNVGLFANTKMGAEVKNFRLVNTYFKVKGSSGAAAISGGMTNGGSFEKIYTDAILDCDGNFTGGIVSRVTEITTISECCFDGVLQRADFNTKAGGIVGMVKESMLDVEHCLFSGKIYQGDVYKMYGGSNARVGGVLGFVEGACTVNIRDSLVVGELETKASTQVGAILGYTPAAAKTTFDRVFALTDTYERIASGLVYIHGSAIRLPEDMLAGYEAYRWTNLDFDKYWSVVSDGTPELQCFADEVVSTEGVARGFDVDWYTGNSTEYTLTTREQLYGLSLLSACTDFTDITVKLGNDIAINEGSAARWAKTAPEYQWIPIARWTGTFDGQGHTVSGIYVDCDEFMGFFKNTLANSTVKNLRVTNSYYNNTSIQAAYTGGVVGSGGGTLDTLYSDAILHNSGTRTGGIIGAFTVTGAKVTNCWFDGEIYMHGETGFMGGGIAGCNDTTNVVIEHCLNTGNISAERTVNYTRMGGICSTVNGGYSITIADCFTDGTCTGYEKQVGSVIGFIGADAVCSFNSVITTDRSYNKTIGQNVGVAAGSPVPYAYETLLGAGGYQWTNLDFDNYWVAVKDGTPMLRSFAASSMSVSGLQKKFDTSWYNKDKKVYILTDAKDLYGLAIVEGNGESFAGKTVQLGANIVANTGDASTWGSAPPADPWMPVGKFMGTFDGKGYTISGLYKSGGTKLGLFSETGDTAVIKNLRFVNSYFGSTKETGNVQMGGIVGQGAGTFDTIYVDIILESTGARVGGILGFTSVKDTNTTIRNCWFNGTINLVGGTKAARAGGILGMTYYDATITSCLNTGEINGTGGSGVAGIVGNPGSNSTVTVTDSLNVGKVTNTGSQTGSLVGVVSTEAVIHMDKTYVTAESYSKALGYLKIGTFKGACTRLPQITLTGAGGYEYTNLDFDKYWALVPDGTPVLKSFASSGLTTAGLEKKFDTSWYKEKQTTFTLTDWKDLYGVAVLAAQGVTFEGKVLKLGADITVNTGDASAWGSAAPANIWIPIADFAGTFNGQGKTISGLYKANGTQIGLFSNTTAAATIQNLRVENSYFANTTQTGNIEMGGIAGRGAGNFDTIYADIILESTGARVGGILGFTNLSKTMTKIRNCWFAGKINMLGGSKAARAGGILGVTYYDATITACLNTGEINGTGGNGLGGIVGNPGSSSTVTIKESLNIGKVTSKTSQSGSIIGVVSTDAKIKIDGVYATTDSYSKWIGSNLGSQIGKEAATQVEIEKIFGQNAKVNAPALNYEKDWTTLTKRTPVLTSFVDKAPTQEYEGIISDTSWYNETDKEFILTTADQLYGFQELSRRTDFKKVTIKLGADITINKGNAKDWATKAPTYTWTPIGTTMASKYPFAGTFDGQGHTISGLYLAAANNRTGLFTATTSDSKICNLRLVNSYFANTTAPATDTHRPLGGIAAYGGGVYENIYCDIIIRNAASTIGGLVGSAESTYGDLTITNCWFDGTLILASETARKVGGFVGVTYKDTNIKIEHCLFTGTVDYGKKATEKNVDIGGMVGVNGEGRQSANTTISDSLSVGTITGTNGKQACSVVGFTRNTSTLTLTNVYADSAMGTDTYTKESNTATVNGEPTKVAYSNLIGENAKENAGGLGYTNYWVTRASSTPMLRSFHWYYADPNADAFTIYDAADLYDFAAISKTNNFAKKTVYLGADITVNEGNAEDWATKAPTYTWTPIGGANSETANKAFAGTFDGQGHTISGLYGKSTNSRWGLFYGTAGTSTVKNLKLKNSYFANTANGTVYRPCGGVAAYGGGKFDTIYCDVIISNGAQGVGGIVGDGGPDYGELSIHNCWFKGTILLPTAGARYAGGIVGATRQKTTISNCLFTGIINYGEKASTMNVGIGGIIGMAGQVNNPDTVLKNVLSAGTITGENGNWLGSVVGYATGTTSLEVENAYGDSKVCANTHNKATGVTLKGNFTKVAHEKLIGEKAKTNAGGLDYAKYWETQSNGTPILKSFREEAGAELKASPVSKAAIRPIGIALGNNSSSFIRFVNI